jgi:hypothetical protein
MDGGATVVELELGSFRFKAFWLTRVDVNMKNISNRNMISVIDDILNSAEVLDLLTSPITFSFSWLSWLL